MNFQSPNSVPAGAVDAFKRAYKEETGLDISDEEAFDMALNLLQLYDLIYRPLPEIRCDPE